MSERKDGGPAFPGQGTAIIDPGMSLRDWFAGQALIGLLASTANPNSSGPGQWEKPQLPAFAYEVADAMLAERERKP